jgi:hypothetical protein
MGRAACSGDILDDDPLTERARHVFAEDAGGHVTSRAPFRPP